MAPLFKLLKHPAGVWPGEVSDRDCVVFCSTRVSAAPQPESQSQPVSQTSASSVAKTAPVQEVRQVSGKYL